MLTDFDVENWQTIDLTTMEFPAEMLVDYVRVYQRKGSTNVGCSPSGYPTADYINNHADAYESKSLYSCFFLSFFSFLFFFFPEADVLFFRS